MEFRLPELGEGVYEAELVEWHVRAGDRVRHGQALAEVMTDKATMELPSPFTGAVGELMVQSGAELKIGDVILTYQPDQPTTPGDDEPAQNGDNQATPTGGNGEQTAGPASLRAAPADVRAAPSVRRKARELGIDLTQVSGSGPGGRILMNDLSDLGSSAPTPAPSGPRPPEPRQRAPGARIKLKGLRRKIAEQMVRSKRTIPHYSYIDECDVTELVGLRQSLKPAFANTGIRLTYLPFIVKAAAGALTEFPGVNASLDDETGEIVLHDCFNIGIAVATPGGLMVPVIHDADQKPLQEIARDIERLSADARQGKSSLPDMRGGTFTITSIGGIGGLISTPIINHPEVAILGAGKIIRRPVYDEHGEIRPADLLYLSFSFDHRALDGDVGAHFSNAIIRRLQNPASLLLPDQLD